DPIRLADVADALAQRLGELDTDNADTFSDNAAELRTSLEELDVEFTDGLASCANTDLVTSHNAFGYLAEAYGFTQVGITGLTPEEEPSAADLAEVADFVEENDVRTIYYETLVSPAIADAVAAETGAQTALLDPLEGLTDESEGSDYLEVMRSNLENVRAGQPCD
nr:zinc ABC transporter substrate-binding protein [Geodermatophilaceae bacterium]